ncbi:MULTISPECIES: arginine--tRNA ligase [Bacillaceae]|uniref:arginine--tRNA ligase n=1 Tax=Alteribacter populi TaxID=2011011 RepID=UPI0018E23920
MNVKSEFVDALASVLKGNLPNDTIKSLIEKPKSEEHGDLAFPCFQLARTWKTAPPYIAVEVASKLQSPMIEKVKAVGPYVNVFLKKELVSENVLKEVVEKGSHYGHHSAGQGKNAVFDFSSPNIAKPFSMGHLRSTIIGQSLANLAEKNGYQPVRVNHLGDWGTQFGKLMSAYTRWGFEEEVQQAPIPSLMRYYVRFHEEADNDPSLLDEGRAWFKKLEEGDSKATELWTWFKEESLKEFEKVYQLLGITFDYVQGESFYNDKMEAVVAELGKKGLLTVSEGAHVVKVGEEKPPCLIKKTDGTTLYATRDLAAAIYRQQTFNFSKCIYVVGAEQQLHFQQIVHVLAQMGYSWAKEMVHVPFGLILKNGKKMSTRKGKIVLLEDVLTDAITRASSNIAEKNPSLTAKEEVAKDVGVGAVIFHDLKNERMNSVEFNLKHMLTFEGETGPYVQYTHARAMSILRKAESYNGEVRGLGDEASWIVIKELMNFPEVTKRAWENYEPSVMAKYLLALSSAFNKYYGKVKILNSDAELSSRLILTKAVVIVLKEGLRLLGMKAPNRM